MPYAVIRIAPSGAPVENPEGGEALPGEGFPLRLAEAAFTLNDQPVPDAYAALEEDGGAACVVSLDNPSPLKRYRFYGKWEVDSLAGGLVLISTRIMIGYDFGVPVAVDSNDLQLGDAQSRACWLLVPPTLGSVIPGAPVPAAATSMQLYIYIRAGTALRAETASNESGPTGMLSILETL